MATVLLVPHTIRHPVYLNTNRHPSQRRRRVPTPSIHSTQTRWYSTHSQPEHSMRSYLSECPNLSIPMLEIGVIQHGDSGFVLKR